MKPDALLPTQPGVFHQPRDARPLVKIDIPFTMLIGDHVLTGQHFTLNQITTLRHGEDGRDLSRSEITASKFGSEPVSAGMVVQLHGYDIGLNLKVILSPRQPDESGSFSFGIVDMDPVGKDAFRQIIRSYHSGYLPGADELLVKTDPETGRALRDTESPNAVPNKWLQGLAIVMSTAMLLFISALSVAALYQRFFIVQSDFAAFTAPQLEFKSTARGQVELGSLEVGDMTSRDQVLYQVQVGDLDAEIEYAVAHIEMLQLSSGTELKMPPTDPSGSTLGRIQIETLNNGPVVPVPGGNLSAQIRLESARLDALELRRAELTEYAPCDCLVAYSVENGTFVNGGDNVVVLARVGSVDIQVEATVNLKHASEFFVGQMATIENPATGETTPARISRISLDGSQQPRFGFPEWVRHQPTLASIMLAPQTPVSSNMIGLPVTVRIEKPSVFGWIFGSQAQAGNR